MAITTTTSTSEFTEVGQEITLVVNYNAATNTIVFAWGAKSDTVVVGGGLTGIDNSDCGMNNTVVVGEDFDGAIRSVKWNEEFQLCNTVRGNSIWPDIIGSLPLDVVDGEWV